MIVDELKDFRIKLMKYFVYRKKQIMEHKKLTEKEKEGLVSIYDEISINAGKYAPLVKEYTGLETISTSAGPQDVWNWAFSFEENTLVVSALSNCFQATSRAIGKLEDDIEMGIRDKQGNVVGEPPKVTKKPTEDTGEIVSYLFDKMQFHPKIVNASRALFVDEHYAQAIFEAFKAVENFVQDKSGLALYGTNLMERVFNEENPIIKVPEAGHYYKEVQKGFKHLFIGASQGIRNPKAHKEIIQKDPYITLQYLGFFSFLLKRIDYWETGVS